MLKIKNNNNKILTSITNIKTLIGSIIVLLSFCNKIRFFGGWDEQERKGVDGDQGQCGGVTELVGSREKGRQFHQMLLPSTYRTILIEFCEKEQRGRRK